MASSPLNLHRIPLFYDHAVLVHAQEAVLGVEYFLAVVPPDTQQALPHDDWCACNALAS